MHRPSQTNSPNHLGWLPAVTIVLHNSDEHTLPYCIEMLRRCFGYNESDAYQLAYTVHSRGWAPVWTGSFELAELKCEQVAQFVPSLPLATSASSPAHVSFPSQPLNVTIEPLQLDAERISSD